METTFVNEKNEMRKKMRTSLIKYVKDVEKAQSADEKATELFLNSDIYKEAPLILAFVSLGVEINTHRIIAKCLYDNKAVAIPRIIPGTNKMEFFKLENIPFGRQTESGSYGIVEPLKSLKKIKIRKVPEKTIILVPGLAFTPDGKRLGKGMGFYDYYLSKLFQKNKKFRKTGICAGFCYSVQIQKEIPVDEHDFTISHIISEKGIVECTK